MDCWDFMMRHSLAVSIVVSIISSVGFSILFGWLWSIILPHI